MPARIAEAAVEADINAAMLFLLEASKSMLDNRREAKCEASYEIGPRMSSARRRPRDDLRKQMLITTAYASALFDKARFPSGGH